MATMDINNLIHGRETYAVYYGDEFVMKRPLPTLTIDAKNAWLAKQHKTKDIIDAIREHMPKNASYKVPAMRFIEDNEYQLLEERAIGEPLTAQLYSQLTPRQQSQIIIDIANFLVDTNESRPVGETTPHKIT